MCAPVCGTRVNRRHSLVVRVALEAGGLSDLLTKEHGSPVGAWGRCGRAAHPPSDRKVPRMGGQWAGAWHVPSEVRKAAGPPCSAF